MATAKKIEGVQFNVKGRGSRAKKRWKGVLTAESVVTGNKQLVGIAQTVLELQNEGVESFTFVELQQQAIERGYLVTKQAEGRIPGYYKNELIEMGVLVEVTE